MQVGGYMAENKKIFLNLNVLSSLKKEGDLLRQELSKDDKVLINIMASPGGGKTTTLISLIPSLKKRYQIGILEADLESDYDSLLIEEKTGIKAVQIHTDSLCHINVDMTREGLKKLQDCNLIFIENVGNILCPSKFDTGAHFNISIIPITDGTEKIFNYEEMIKESDLILINKIDAISYCEFDFKKVNSFINHINNKIKVITYSAKTEEGIEEVVKAIEELLGKKRR